MTLDLDTCAAHEIADGVRGGELKATEVLDHFLVRIDATEGAINAWVASDFDAARDQAEQIDTRVADGDDPGVLAGVPIGVKDVDELIGFRTTWGSNIHADDAPSEVDGHHIARLRNAGVVFIGKTTTSEFGSAGFTNTLLTGVTRNPWDTALTSGGSSGGSSAAVAAGQLPLATGGDGGGSIRLPSHFTNTVGMKASAGRIPIGPARADWSRCVQRGPISRTVRDTARYIDAASGRHPMDRNTYIGGPTRLEQAIETIDLSAKKVVWTDTMGYGVSDPHVASVCRDAADTMIEAAGLDEVGREIDWPDPGAAWLVTMALDLGAELPDYLGGDGHDLTPIVQFSLQAVHEHLKAPQIAHAIDLRLRFEALVAEFFEEVDLLVSPTAPIPAFRAEGPMPTEIAGQHVPATAAAAFTYPFNLSGNPAISVPAGLVDGLPVGLQIVGRMCADDEVVAAAAACEAAWRPAPEPFPAR